MRDYSQVNNDLRQESQTSRICQPGLSPSGFCKLVPTIVERCGLLSLLDSHPKGFAVYLLLVISCLYLVALPLKEAKMSEGALKSNYSKASRTQMAWTAECTEMTESLVSRMRHMSWKDQKELQWATPKKCRCFESHSSGDNGFLL